MIFLDPAANQDCLGDDAVFFVQHTCIQSEEQQNYKYTNLCYAVGAGSVICLLFTVGIRYLYQGGKIQQLEWDMATITAGDYTVEFYINGDKYRKWKSEKYQEHKDEEDVSQQKAPALYLKEYMIERIEKAVTK